MYDKYVYSLKKYIHMAWLIACKNTSIYILIHLQKFSVRILRTVDCWYSKVEINEQ